jgi:hypothetical protein
MVTQLPPDAKTAAPLESADRATQSIPTLLHRLTHELSTLFRQELALASAELTRKFGTVLAALLATSAGALVLFAGLLVLLAAAVLGLSRLMAPWLAALVVGVGVSIVGIAALVTGSRGLRHSLLPKRSARSLASDKDVITRRKS